ncbi:MAG TPA: cytochrome b5 domain-containing protein [Clostridiaceae bacterium]|nr:cytochrome b5 domain-containing protein [Clostridiaceae bacterium]
MKKIRNLSLILVLVMSLGILAACASDTTTTPPATPPATPPVTAPETPGTGGEGDMEFTLEELAKYNGKDGNRAYVAVDGIVYDVTDVPPWKGGEHQGRVSAGNDLSDEIEDLSPHGKSVLEDLPVVGTLVP